MSRQQIQESDSRRSLGESKGLLLIRICSLKYKQAWEWGLHQTTGTNGYVNRLLRWFLLRIYFLPLMGFLVPAIHWSSVLF